MNPQPSRRDWHIPLSQDPLTLRAALDQLRAFQAYAAQDHIPLMIQLLETPRFDIPGFHIFPGAVDLRAHDCIHILLGRGLTSKDEAFVIGFTMGSTNRVSTTEEFLFGIAAKFLYPKFYRFDDQDLRIFRDAVKLGYISDCRPLNEVDFEASLDLTLAELRDRVGLEASLLLAYFEIEARRHPEDPACLRLLG